MKNLIKTVCSVSAFIIMFMPAFALPTETTVEKDIDDYCKPPGCIADVAYYVCSNPSGTVGDTIMSTCPDGKGVQSLRCLYEGASTMPYIGAVPFWQAVSSCSPAIIPGEKLCLVGYVYDPATDKCRFQCDDGKFVDNKLACQEVAVIEQVCSPGTKGYQTCEKNGVDCGTQERTCSALGQWPATWSECKVL